MTSLRINKIITVFLTGGKAMSSNKDEHAGSPSER